MTRSRNQNFEEVAGRVTPSVASYLARRMYPLSLSELDDLIEEVLLILWRRIDQVPSDAEIPWAIGVARNVRRNAVRKQNNGNAAFGQLRPVGDTPSAEDVVVADDAVRRALDSLTDDDRDLLILHYWDGVAANELAIILGISANAAAVRLSRALHRFEREFESVHIA